MTVPFVDLRPMHEPLQEPIAAAILETVSRGDFILGQGVAEFEQAFAEFLGVNDVVGVGSGTAALSIALTAAGVGAGDEVIVPAHTYIASALAVSHAGATPIFCDVDPATGLLDLDSADEVIGPRTAAVIAVHLYGQVCDMEAVLSFAEKRGLALVEDAAQAHGARQGTRRTGSFGLAAAFSFYPSKNLGAFGDGGAIATSDASLAERARRLRNLGQLGKGDHELPGRNERLDSIQAVVLSAKLPHLDGWNTSRAAAAARYREALPPAACRLRRRDGFEDVYHLFPIRVDDRDAVKEALAKRGIGCAIHYTPAVHQQPPFVAGAPRTELPAAVAWAASELSLPMFAGIGIDQVDRVCDELAAILGTS